MDGPAINPQMTEAQIQDQLNSPDVRIRELARELLKLRQAIQHLREQTGHALCWLNDVELWSVLETSTYPHPTLPVRDEFLQQCRRYYESRIQGTAYEEPTPTKTIEG